MRDSKKVLEVTQLYSTVFNVLSALAFLFPRVANKTIPPQQTLLADFRKSKDVGRRRPFRQNVTRSVNTSVWMGTDPISPVAAKHVRPELFGAPELCATTNGSSCVTDKVVREGFGIRSHEMIARCSSTYS
jgi:hypothetical protein